MLLGAGRGRQHHLQACLGLHSFPGHHEWQGFDCSGGSLVSLAVLYGARIAGYMRNGHLMNSVNQFNPLYMDGFSCIGP